MFVLPLLAKALEREKEIAKEVESEKERDTTKPFCVVVTLDRK